MAFFVGNEIYDHLEKVVDRFDDVGNVIHGIVLGARLIRSLLNAWMCSFAHCRS